MQSITADQLIEMRQRNSNLLLVNTLPPDSFESTKIDGAVNAPQDDPDFVETVERYAGGKSKPVVVYCASSDCASSEKGAEKLEKAGFAEVFDFTAGAKGWEEAHAGSAS